MKVARLYVRNGIFYFVPVVSTTNGLLVGWKPIRQFPINTSSKQLGEALMSTLDHYSEGVELNIDKRDRIMPLLEAANCKTYKLFTLGSQLISCRLDADRILTLSPLINLGFKNGFASQPNKNEMIKLDDVDFDIVGKFLFNVYEKNYL